MDMRYEAYCFADPIFYDAPISRDPSHSTFSSAGCPLPVGWERRKQDVWTVLLPTRRHLRSQGWKIHISATLDNADQIVSTTWSYCVENGISFKFLSDMDVLLTRNSKYAPREASGKLATIYPEDDAQLLRILTDLSIVLGKQQGPYILSDLRYGPGPLYVRYGGFVERWVAADTGEQVLAIERPDGTLVPDERKPVFTIPEWVEIPDFLHPHLEVRESGQSAPFPYRVESSLHFSNGGGVYLARRLADDQRVVLKEARPFAGLDKDGIDAVRRLHRERDALERLRGIEGVPELYDHFTAWEHHYIAMQHMPGITLGQWLARQYPLIQSESGEQEIADFTHRALRLVTRIEALVSAIHARGLVFGDLHPNNILVDDEDSVALVDFELSFDVDEPRRPALGAPGFIPPADRHGVAIDRYALAALRLWLFLPLNVVLTLEHGKLAQYIATIEERFELPAGYTDVVLRQLARAGDSRTARNGGVHSGHACTELDQPEPNWTAVRKSLAEAILLSATPDRDDRLFPGDIQQFSLGGGCFAYGAAGVLHALSVSGIGRFPQHEQWLLDSVRRSPPRRPGFYDGAHGIAYVLENLGHHDLATALVDEFARTIPTLHDHGLRSGLAGIGLNLLHFANTRNDHSYHKQAVAIGDRLAEAIATAAEPETRARAGLMHGWSGPALLFVRLHERTGDRGWLELADRALLRDIAKCVETRDGAMAVRDRGIRTLSYLEIGAAGIVLVGDELIDHVAEPRCSAELPKLRRSCYSEFTAFAGLFSGRAGLLGALASSLRHRPGPQVEQVVSRHLARLAWHALSYRGHLAFPGNELLRLSMDLATGSAGVLLAITAATEGNGALLPFLSAPRGERPNWSAHQLHERPAGARMGPGGPSERQLHPRRSP
jgi:tRNA A-37 threonylcarbamoyl transferase component Bud32